VEPSLWDFADEFGVPAYNFTGTVGVAPLRRGCVAIRQDAGMSIVVTQFERLRAGKEAENVAGDGRRDRNLALVDGGCPGWLKTRPRDRHQNKCIRS
jgi:hypothetical protein